MKSIRHMTEEELRDKLVREEVSVSELDLSKVVQRKALLAAVKERNALLKKIKCDNAEQILIFIFESGEENYKLFVQLERSQYTEKLLQFYFAKRVEEDSSVKGVELPYKFQASRSLDEKNTFTYSYVTVTDDQLNYMDKDVGVPLSLKSSIKATLRLSDAMKLLDKMDTSVAYLGIQKIKGELFDVLTSQYKASLGAFLAEKGFGFYSLGGALGEAQEYIKRDMAEKFAEYGIAVSEFVIRKIAIPEDVQSRVEDLAFTIRQERAEMEAEAELARISLKNYEEKLAIESKYPDAEHSLTEHEKDLALKRYLRKSGLYSEETVDRAIALGQHEERADKVINKQVDVRPFEPKKSSFKAGYFALLALCLFIVFIALISAESFATPLVMLGIVIFIFGIVGALNFDKLKSNVAELDSDDDNAPSGEA